MYTTNKATRSIADAALKVMMDEAKSPAQQAAIAIAMKEKGQKPKEEMKEALHPNQQKLDVHEPEKDELTAKDFEMLRKGKKAPVKKVTEGTNVTDYNPKSQGGTRKEFLSKYHNTKDPKDAEAARKAGATQKELQGVAEGTIAGDILKKIDEMKGPWPGTPEYKKKFPEREMKPGEEKATKTGIVKKTIKGVVHTAKPMKEEVEVNQEEPQVKVLAKEEASFQNLINLYIDNGVESLLQTMEKLKEEASNDEFTKEVEEHKKKAEGKVEQPEVSKGAVKAVAVTKEEIEQIDEISSGLATSYLNKREPQHKPNMNTPETSNRDAKVAKGIRGAVSRVHGYGPDKGAENKVTGRFQYRKNVGATHTFNKEEVVAEGGFFDPDQPNIGDTVKHINGATGKVKKIGTQGGETHVYFKDKNGEMNSGMWKKHVHPIKKKVVAEEIEQMAVNHFDSIEKGKKIAEYITDKLGDKVEELTTEQIEMIFEQIDIQLDERSMTEPEMKKREDIVKGMKKNLAGFKERYGEKAKSVMYATATKQAMKD